VIERQPVAMALIGGVAHLVDGEGYVIGLTGKNGADDLPVISGLDGRYGDALSAVLCRGVSMLERLNVRAPLFAARLSELDLSDPSNVVVHTLDGGPRLLLDPEHVERNVNRWLELGRAIGERAGALDYVDLRWSKRIAVKPLRP
jgi:cell division septal protein FtsQ